MLEQPVSNVVLPEDVQSATESARANVSILESKATVLQSANFAMQKDNAKLLKEQEYLQSQVKDSEGQVEKLTASIVELQKAQGELLAKKTEIDAEIALKQSNQSNIDAEVASKLQTIKAQTDLLNSGQAQLEKDQQALSDERKAFDGKVSKLKEALSLI